MLLFIRIRWQLASILLSGLVLLLCACIVKINYHFDEPQSEYQYYTGSVLLFFSSMIANAGAGEILYRVVPPSFALRYWNAGMIAGTAELAGKTIGFIAFFFYAYVNRDSRNRAEPFFAYIVNSVVVLLLVLYTCASFKKLQKHNAVTLEAW